MAAMNVTDPPSATAVAAAARQRANTELGLLILALLVTLVAAALVELSQQPVISPEVVVSGAVFLAGAVAAHVVKRFVASGSDPVLLPLAVLLNGLGLVMVRRIDFARVARNPDVGTLADAQTIWSLVALVAFCVTLIVLRDHLSLDRYRYLLGLGSLLLMLMPLLPVIGREINGARIWVQFGGLTFQPVEFAKLGLTIFFASYLAEKRDILAVATNRLGPVMVPPARAFAPLLGIWAIGIAVLGLQNDLGPTLLFYGVFIVALYVATGRLAYPLAGIALAGVGALLAYQMFGHVRLRFAIWLDVWSMYTDEGYQLAQSLFALGTGGVAGVGFGQGQPEFIPFVETDFIFSAFGEEIGLLGTTAILLCFLLLASRGFRIALTARDEFGALLAAGLTTILGLQVFIIVGGVTRLIPLTGITLPFMSYGGSSLLSNYILIALLARISAPAAPLRRRRRPVTDDTPEPAADWGAETTGSGS
jgi:cell division protein FtsW (lipid II flippase)